MIGSNPADVARDVRLPSDRSITWYIARRAAIESLRDRTTVGVSAFLSLVVPFLAVLLVVRPQTSLVGATASGTLGILLAVTLLGVGLMPANGSTGIAAGLFAGEKEQGSLLPLLATPASNRAIFAGKVLGAVLPTLLYTTIAEVSFLTEIWLFLGSTVLRNLPLGLTAAMVLLVPADAVLGAAVASLVSSRVRTFQSAQMLTNLALFPIMGGQVAFASRLQQWGIGALALALSVIVALDVLLIVIAAATWQREEVMARR